MERATILRRRLQQQHDTVQQLEHARINRARARLIRPLFAARLPAWAAAMAGAPAVQDISAIPLDKIVGDQRSIIVEQPVRDYVTTKVFQLPSLNALFLLLIDAQWLELTLITRHYRLRHAYHYSGPSGHWLPRGDYVLRTVLATLDWQDLPAAAAVDLLLAEALRQQPLILRMARHARHDQLRRWWYGQLRQALLYLGYGLVALIGWLLLTWLLRLFQF